MAQDNARSLEDLTKENLELRKALSRFSEQGTLDIQLAQQLLSGGTKAVAALTEIEYFLERKGKDKTACATRLKTAIKTVPDDVYDLDKLIKKLDNELQVVVTEHYQHSDCSLDQRYKQCGCGRDTYYRRLSKAHHSLVFLGKPLIRRKVKLSTV